MLFIWVEGRELLGVLVIRVSLLDEFEDIFVVNEFASVGSSDSLFYLSQKPSVVIHKALNHFSASASGPQPCSAARVAILACRSGRRFSSISLEGRA